MFSCCFSISFNKDFNLSSKSPLNFAPAKILAKSREKICFTFNFSGTSLLAILIAKPSATDQEIIDALKVANAWEFVKDLPQKINHNIGESGNKLSGGQKQRLSIARAVLKNPAILVLDEATSALDSESEKLVQDALINLMKNKTSIVIAHRLSTIQNADKIIVLDNGKIIEEGKHKELMSKKGTYNALVKMQSLIS